MTAREIKVARRNELLKAFNPNAANTETLIGMRVTFTKKSVRIINDGCVTEYPIHQVIIENQPINYIVK